MKKIKPVRISNSIIFDNSFIYLQSMCSYPYSEKEKLENQIYSLSKTNCSLIRLSIRNEKEIEFAKELKEKYQRDDFIFVADTHFLPRLAILSIKNGFRKVRINPGNMDFKQINEIAKVAKDFDSTIRIGLNGGSINEKVDLEKSDYVKQIIKLFETYLEPFEKENFDKIVLSAKFSDYNLAIKVNRELNRNFSYPIHLGVTEAGTKIRSTILHTLFLDKMIKEGIGSTVRISITGDSIEEIDIGNEILKSLGVYRGINVISCPTCGRTWGNLTRYVQDLTNLIKPLEYQLFKKESMIKKPISVAIMGCEVNGPGEAKDADFGASLTKDGAILFSQGKIDCKITKEKIAETLMSLIQNRINKN
ncbi:MAG: flavodoxin-dependent (E)-4-hydroxy-3-methylbut-2-enyl-diphosphate synthase [Exilispira sp.]|nr:flavodoxin-dependent (E)-4-hydroxy-3-methylbut-2-enyl-diphosphate synthase [Exilispira sp.]